MNFSSIRRANAENSNPLSSRDSINRQIPNRRIFASDVKRGQNFEAEAEARNNYEKSTK